MNEGSNGVQVLMPWLRSGESATREEWSVRLNCKPEDIEFYATLRSRGALYLKPKG